MLRLQNAARNSTEWFENVARYAKLPAEQFAYSLLTRSQRISHENLRLRDKGYVERIERWFARGAPVPPMFTPFRLRELILRNRVVVSPMDMYSAVDGLANDFHLVHLGSRAIGGAGLVYTEMTCVSPKAASPAVAPACTTNEQMFAYKRIVDFVHANSNAKICLQLGHSGPKGSTKLMWEGMDEPLEEGNWEVVGALARCLRTAESSAARTDAADDGNHPRTIRSRDARWVSKPVSICSNCTARTGTCSQLHHAVAEQAYRRIRRFA